MPGSGLPSEILKRRPDIMEAEQLVRSANATVGVKVDEFMPLVNLNNFVGGAGELGELLGREVARCDVSRHHLPLSGS